MNATVDTTQTIPSPSVTESRGVHDARIPLSVGIGVVTLAILIGLATFTILTGLTSLQPGRATIIGLLGVNLAMVLAMVGMIAWQVFLLLRAKKRKIAGSRLHVRIVSLFSIIAALPAIVVAIFASVTLDKGLDAWFSERTQAIVDTSIVVAKAYVQEHANVIRGDVMAMAADLTQAKSAFDRDRPAFDRFFITQTALRGLDAAFLINRKGAPVTKTVIDKKIKFENLPNWVFDRVDERKHMVLRPGQNNVVRAVVKLERFDGLYLYVHRFIDEVVVDHLRKARESKVEYATLEGQRYGVQITFALMYVGVSLIFLLAAIWLGFSVADRMVQPIVRLVGAARSVSEGVLDIKVPVHKSEGDLATLGRTFNKMTNQLSSQRDELIDANHMLDRRRRFTEAVLSGVTAGVIGLDQQGVITLVNRSAPKLLGKREKDLFGQDLSAVVPEMGAILDKARGKASGSAEGHVGLLFGGQERSFLVRVTTEQSSEAEHGYVVTFDDMTELVSAQRNSAWADIARRIAHEIKNPLTPIQLSAERLKRKYQKEIQSDPSVFEQCTETIIRQVGDIGRMVDEFSTFARMPKAVMERQNLDAIVKEAMVLQRVGSSEITFDFKPPEEPIHADIDRGLVTQAITNLLKNASEAIEARVEKEPDVQGHIDVSVSLDDTAATVDVADNGVGLPHENRQRLFEPYMTTREKGTGLGLAIVKKIMEEHGGNLSLHDAPATEDGHKGALVRLEFPLVVAKGSQDAAKAGEGKADVGNGSRTT